MPAATSVIRPFLRHNTRLVREVEDLESRSRRRDILGQMTRCCSSFTTSVCRRTSCTAYTVGRLQAWLKKRPAGGAGRLRMSRDLLLARDPGGNLGAQFPDDLDWEDMRFRLSYQFRAGRRGRRGLGHGAGGRC